MNAFIIYLILFRLAIISAGVISIILGYRLFLKGVGWDNNNTNNTSVEAEIGMNKFSMRNAAPGTCFALFGVFIIISMFVSGGPELTLKQIDKFRQDSSKTNSKIDESSWELSMKGITDPIELTYKTGLAFEMNQDTLRAISTYEKAIDYLPSELFNSLAWLYIEVNKLEEAIPLSILAVKLEPYNANFLDTYSEILYRQKKFDEALSTIEEAAKIDPYFKSKVPKFKNAVQNDK